MKAITCAPISGLKLSHPFACAQDAMWTPFAQPEADMMTIDVVLITLALMVCLWYRIIHKL